jgi:hypothetical protein
LCGETGVLVVGFVHVHSGSGSSIRQLWAVCGLFPCDIVTEYCGDGEEAPRYGPKRMASIALVHSDCRVDSAHHLVRAAGEGESVWEPRASNTEFRLTAIAGSFVWLIGEAVRHLSSLTATLTRPE